MIPAYLALTLAAALAFTAPSATTSPNGGRHVGPDGHDALSEGQRLYDAGDYKAAAGWYGQAVARERRNADLHYNLGNALFKDGRTGPAIASYQRAFSIRPRDPDIRQNLDFALRRAGENLVPPGVPPLLFIAFHLFSERELSGLHWLACWLALLLAGLFVWKGSRRETLLPWTAAAWLLWLVLGGWWLALRLTTPQRSGVIVSASAEIRSGPGDNFSVSFTAPEGRRVQILSDSGEWLEIGMLKEGVKGWIAAAAVEPI
ncbi:MAG: tetratricopeptide repeat protein [Elusimicrobiota bacterium]|jgi:tetratricopeptide (TPR) repeat protein